jgi:hypothetical protein
MMRCSTLEHGIWKPLLLLLNESRKTWIFLREYYKIFIRT